ncbi:MAG TPA: hypothetical protein VNV82_14450 [Bryobacteraceae bacterium]|jgi:hypothetical protein|nr:hypothetical protein [Bryobacteraceae bacterium]
MKSAVRFVTIAIPVLVILAVASLVAADLGSVQPRDFTVHEWGTFTSVAGEDGSPVDWDALGCKSDLPRFVNDYGYRGFKFKLRGTVRMETPVMYFYSPRELDAHVKVAFPQGLITEWYPQAEYEVFQKSRQDGSLHRLGSNLNGLDTSLRSLTGAMEWQNVKVQPGSAPVLPVESDSSRYYAARATDSAPIMVGDQHEKFLFYRGVGRFPVPLSARRVSGYGEILVENRSHEAVPYVILFENRGGRMGYRSVGAVEDAVALESPSLDSSLSQLRHDLETALIAQGLFPKEAQAMLETWRDSWFEEGTRLIYVLPSAAVDAILPLQIEPAPSETVRVFVGRIELVTPETKGSVESAIAKSDWPALERYSRFLDPILRRIYPGNPTKASVIEQTVRNLQGIEGCR